MLENAGGTVRESDTRHHVRDIQQDLALIGAVHNTHSDEGREELQSGLEARGGNGANNLHRNTAASTIHDLRRHPGKQTLLDVDKKCANHEQIAQHRRLVVVFS